MSLHSGTKSNKDKNTKAKDAIPIAGAIVTAAILLSGLLFIGSYPQAVAQESNMTGGIRGAISNATSGGGNASMIGGGGGAATGNQSSSDVRTNLEQARMSLQNNDTQSARMYIDMALSALGGSMTGGGAASNMTGGSNMTGASAGGATNMTSGGGTTSNTSGGTSGDGGGILGGIFGGGQ